MATSYLENGPAGPVSVGFGSWGLIGPLPTGAKTV